MLIKTKAKSALKMLITLIFSLVLCTSGLLIIQKPTQVSASGQVSINTSLDSNQQSEKTSDSSTDQNTSDNKNSSNNFSNQNTSEDEKVSSVSTNGKTLDNEETIDNSINKNLPVSKATAGSSAVLAGPASSNDMSGIWSLNVEYTSMESLTITTDPNKIVGFTKDNNVADSTSDNELYAYYKRCSSNSNYDYVFYADVEKVYAPVCCYSLFGGLEQCKSITFDNFDTSNVTDMNEMFSQCSSLTSLDLSGFDTSNVTNMSRMFSACASLKSITFGDNFNTSNVTNMGCMFDMNDNSPEYYSSLINLDLSGFNTSNVTNMYCMFGSCSSLKSITLGNDFDTSNVTNMSQMFLDCSSLTSLDVSKFNTSKVTTMWSMFANCSSLTSLDVSNFDTSNVINMPCMFQGCSKLTSLDVGNFDTSKVTSIVSMFKDCSSILNLNLTSFDTSNITSMQYLFSGCSSLKSITFGSNFDTSNVTNMGYMFNNCSSLTSLNLNNFNTSNVTNMSYMFQSCSSLTSLDLSNFNTSNVTDMNNMFSSCSSLTSLNVSNFDTSKVKKVMSGMFMGCSSLKTLDISSFSFVSITKDYVERMFGYSPIEIAELIGNGKINPQAFAMASYEKRVQMIISTGTDEVLAQVFANYCSTQPETIIAPNDLNGYSIYLTGEYYYTNGGEDKTTVLKAGKTHTLAPYNFVLPTTLSENWLSKLTSVSPSEISSIKFTSNSSAISGFTKGENVADSTSAEDLYYYYKSNGSGLYDIVVYSENSIYAPTDSTLLFAKMTDGGNPEFLTNCTSIILDNFNTSNAINMMGMFLCCAKVNNLNLSNFDTSNVTSMQMMFTGCLDLNKLDISSLSFDSITSSDGIDAMFGEIGWSQVAQSELGLSGQELEDFLALSFDEKLDYLMEMLGDDVSSKDELIMLLGAEVGLSDISKIIAPTTIPSSLTIALPDTYNYSDPSGNTISTEVLVAGATHISPNTSSSDTNDTGIISDSIFLSLIALCFVFTGFMMLKKRELDKKQFSVS